MEEWTFSWWSADLAGVTFYRLGPDGATWYGWALHRRNEPLLHVVECDIRRRRDPMIAKAEAFWAEYTCESPFAQWTIGNETYAVALDDPTEARRGARGDVVPVASDLEWYATESATPIDHGYRQVGVLLGDVETVDGVITIDETRASRTHRWCVTGELGPSFPPAGVAHLVPSASFVLGDGSVLDLVLTPDGWAHRS